MLNEFFKIIIEINHVLLMIKSLQRKENTKKTHLKFILAKVF